MLAYLRDGLVYVATKQVSSHAIYCWLLACLTSQKHAHVYQRRTCTHNFTCCHTEIEVADPTFYLTQSQYSDTGPTSPSADPKTPIAWQGSHRSANIWYNSTRKNPVARGDSNPGSSALEADALTTRPARRLCDQAPNQPTNQPINVPSTAPRSGPASPYIPQSYRGARPVTRGN